ncbi:MAG: hypothetical protein PWQ72_1227 [Pseudothermotoga sp.]|nr:hypothetical protein [Pseudothermotoga sp.]
MRSSRLCFNYVVTLYRSLFIGIQQYRQRERLIRGRQKEKWLQLNPFSFSHLYFTLENTVHCAFIISSSSSLGCFIVRPSGISTSTYSFILCTIIRPSFSSGTDFFMARPFFTFRNPGRIKGDLPHPQKLARHKNIPGYFKDRFLPSLSQKHVYGCYSVPPPFLCKFFYSCLYIPSAVIPVIISSFQDLCEIVRPYNPPKIGKKRSSSIFTGWYTGDEKIAIFYTSEELFPEAQVWIFFPPCLYKASFLSHSALLREEGFYRFCDRALLSAYREF